MTFFYSNDVIKMYFMQKFKKKRLNNLQTNTIAYKRFSYNRLCELNARESGIKEDFNQNGSLIIS